MTKILPVIPASPKPLPVQYSDAVKAIAKCRSFEDALAWKDKIDVLAAWAKIYQQDTIEREARSLKLYAFRRIGELARELNLKEPKQEAIRAGMSKSNANVALRVAGIPADKFKALAESPRPPAPTVAAHVYAAESPEWAVLSGKVYSLLSAAKQVNPNKAANQIPDKSVDAAFTACRELLLWLVPFHDQLRARRGK